jgi:hypothetical protein
MATHERFRRQPDLLRADARLPAKMPKKQFSGRGANAAPRRSIPA